jgi:hypothetical protein
MPQRFEVEIRVFDEMGKLVRSAMESSSDDDFDEDRIMGMMLADLIDWFSKLGSLQVVCEMLGSVGGGSDTSYKELRKLERAYAEWGGGVPFEECVTVTVNEDKLREDC